ncbi:hypothetical protein BCR33DRAFT_717907, partial [Rhizoclosmatium globosum]
MTTSSFFWPYLPSTTDLQQGLLIMDQESSYQENTANNNVQQTARLPPNGALSDEPFLSGYLRLAPPPVLDPRFWFMEPVDSVHQYPMVTLNPNQNEFIGGSLDRLLGQYPRLSNPSAVAVHPPDTLLEISSSLAACQGGNQPQQPLRSLSSPLLMAETDSIASRRDFLPANLEQPAPTQQIQTIKPNIRSSTSPLLKKRIGEELNPVKEEALLRHIRALKAHRNRPSIKRSFRKCTQCDGVFETSVLLANHLREVHNIQQCPFGRGDKGCTMELNANWREHCIVSHSEAPKPICPECGNTFSSVTSRFRAHLKQCRAGEVET